MGYTGLSGITQWRTWRSQVAAADTQLSDYKPADLTAAVRAAKMIGVHPASVIGIRFFGTDAANEAAGVVISGWMDPGKPGGSGIGHRLWDGDVILGSFKPDVAPVEDKKWDASGYFEVDTITAATDWVGARELVSTNISSMLILPTLGYTHLLLEFVTTFSVAEIGAIWRPLNMGGSHAPILNYAIT